MSDILKKFHAVKAQEIVTAQVNKPIAAIRAEATQKQHLRVISSGRYAPKSPPADQP